MKKKFKISIRKRREYISRSVNRSETKRLLVAFAIIEDTQPYYINPEFNLGIHYISMRMEL